MKTTVEPAHEALLRQWGLLQGRGRQRMPACSQCWTASNAQAAIGRRTIEFALGSSIRPIAWLLPSDYSERPDLAANLERADREYIVACRMAETDLTRGKRIVQGIIYVLVVGVIAGLLGWINEFLSSGALALVHHRPSLHDHAGPTACADCGGRTGA